MTKNVYVILFKNIEKGYSMLKDSHFFCFSSELYMIIAYYLFCLSHNTFDLFYKHVSTVDEDFNFDNHLCIDSQVYSFKESLSRFVSIYDIWDKTLLPSSITPLYICNLIYNIFLNYYDNMLKGGYDADYIEDVIKSVIPSGFLEIYLNTNNDINMLFGKINADILARRNSNEQND